MTTFSAVVEEKEKPYRGPRIKPVTSDISTQAEATATTATATSYAEPISSTATNTTTSAFGRSPTWNIAISV